MFYRLPGYHQPCQWFRLTSPDFIAFARILLIYARQRIRDGTFGSLHDIHIVTFIISLSDYILVTLEPKYIVSMRNPPTVEICVESSKYWFTNAKSVIVMFESSNFNQTIRCHIVSWFTYHH